MAPLLAVFLCGHQPARGDADEQSDAPWSVSSVSRWRLCPSFVCIAACSGRGEQKGEAANGNVQEATEPERPIRSSESLHRRRSIASRRTSSSPPSPSLDIPLDDPSSRDSFTTSLYSNEVEFSHGFR